MLAGRLALFAWLHYMDNTCETVETAGSWLNFHVVSAVVYRTLFCRWFVAK